MTDATRRGATDLAFIEADLVRVVGRVEPIPVFALLGDAQYAQSAAFAQFEAAQQQFLAYYRDRAFDAAAVAALAAQKHAPASVAGLYDVYAERLAAMRADPPTEGWDGVFVLRQK